MANVEQIDHRVQRCRKTVKSYQRKFPSVPTMEWQAVDWDNMVIVDARTQTERKISTIQGAIPLREWERARRQKNAKQDNDHSAAVGIFCTIGYRSGMEGRRLQLQHPELSVYNMSGIVAYVQALHEQQQKSSADDTTINNVIMPPLVDPASDRATDHVHTFGRMWNYVDESHFQAHFFSFPILVVRMMQVGGVSFWRYLQWYGHLIKNACIGDDRRRKEPLDKSD